MSIRGIKRRWQPKGTGKLQLLRRFLHSHQTDNRKHKRFFFFRWVLFRPLMHFSTLFKGQWGSWESSLKWNYNLKSQYVQLYSAKFWNYRKPVNDLTLSAQIADLIGPKLILKKRATQKPRTPRWMGKAVSHLNYYNPKALLRLFLLLYIPPQEKVLGLRVSTLYSLAQKNIRDQINLLVDHLLHKKQIHKIAKQFSNDLENGINSWQSLLNLSHKYFPFSLDKELAQKGGGAWPLQFSETLFFKGLILRRANDRTLETIIDILGTFLYHYDRPFFKNFKHKLSSKGYNITLLFKNWNYFSRETIADK